MPLPTACSIADEDGKIKQKAFNALASALNVTSPHHHTRVRSANGILRLRMSWNICVLKIISQVAKRGRGRLSTKGISAHSPLTASLPANSLPAPPPNTSAYLARPFLPLHPPPAFLPPHHVNAFSRRVYGLEEGGRGVVRLGET